MVSVLLIFTSVVHWRQRDVLTALSLSIQMGTETVTEEKTVTKREDDGDFK